MMSNVKDVERKIEEVSSYQVTTESYKNLMKWLGEIKFAENNKLANYADINMLIDLLHRSSHDLHERWKNMGFMSKVSEKHFKDTQELLVGTIRNLEELTHSLVEENKDSFEKLMMMKVTTKPKNMEKIPTYS